MSAAHASALILCTRDRPRDVGSLLECLRCLDYVPRDILVVDSSTDEATRSVVDKFASRLPDIRVTWHAAPPGLARQRMFGVERLDADVDIVHFIDDDVVLEPGYFEAIEAEFAVWPQVLGVGGRITNLPPHEPSPRHRLELRDSAREGAVLASGVNILVFTGAEARRVHWLSGCSMSFRRRLFDRIAFDTRMTGYSHGEDVDFTFRASRLGPLLSTPRARLRHLCSSVNRDDLPAWETNVLLTRHRFVCELRGHGVSRAAFWWSTMAQLGVAMVNAAANRPGCRERLSILLSAVRRIVKEGHIAPNPRLG